MQAAAVLETQENPIMARLNNTHSPAPDSVFAIAVSRAATAAEREAIQHEEDLERIYRLRKAAANRRCGSSLDSLELARMVGWSA